MLRLGFPVIGVSDLPRAVAFWTAALHLVETDEWATDNWRTLLHANGSGRGLISICAAGGQGVTAILSAR